MIPVSELNLGFSKKEVIPSLPLKKGGSSLPSHKKKGRGEIKERGWPLLFVPKWRLKLSQIIVAIEIKKWILPIGWFTQQRMKEVYWFALSRDVTALSLWADAESSRDDWRKARAFLHLRGSLAALRLDNCGKEQILAGLYTSRALD